MKFTLQGFVDIQAKLHPLNSGSILAKYKNSLESLYYKNLATPLKKPKLIAIKLIAVRLTLLTLAMSPVSR